MKLKGWIFLFILATISWVGCKDDNNDNKTTTLGTIDKNFIQNVAASNSGEIELGQLAATKGTDSLIQAYGQQMVTEHTAAQTELQTLAGKYSGITWPQSPDTATQHRRNVLDSLSGALFDSAYINSQVGDHTRTLLLFRTELDSGNEQSVKDYATKYSPAIQMHLKKADSIRTLLMNNQQNNQQNSRRNN
jgi:putative membrane protein